MTEVQKVLDEMQEMVRRHGMPNYLLNEIHDWESRLRTALSAQQSEAVYQYKRNEKADWTDCTEEAFKNATKAGGFLGWELRVLYTSPSPTPANASDEAVRAVVEATQWVSNSLDNGGCCSNVVSPQAMDALYAALSHPEVAKMLRDSK